MRIFGIIGYPLGHSFSASYFRDKFHSEGIVDAEYRNFPISDISSLPELLKNNPDLRGFNVTIPYKEQIIPYLDQLSDSAREIGAVNCVVRSEGGRLIGYNTDFLGFQRSLMRLLGDSKPKALILGSGGAAKAVAYVLKRSGVDYVIVSRSSHQGCLTYRELTPKILKERLLIINCTPLGTYPEVNDALDIPYGAITEDHLLYDLVYNPPLTQFLERGKERGASIYNGYEMLVIQAEEAWKLFDKLY